nr:hypothetical protein [uncultured Enterobacter sp.]
MNFVYFKAEYPQHETHLPLTLYLKEVHLLRDGEIIDDFGDIKITSLPFFLFSTVTTGFRKIEFTMKTNSTRRITFSSGYLQSGDYIVQTPEGREVTLLYNALSGIWVSEGEEGIQLDNNAFIENNYVLIRPLRITTRSRTESLS